VHDRLESEPDDFHGRVRRHFLDLAAREPARYLVLPADGTREDVHAAVRERVAALLGAGS
jgi:dTMP kinase